MRISSHPIMCLVLAFQKERQVLSTSSKPIFLANLEYAEKSTRSLLIAISSENQEEQELARLARLTDDVR